MSGEKERGIQQASKISSQHILVIVKNPCGIRRSLPDFSGNGWPRSGRPGRVELCVGRRTVGEGAACGLGGTSGFVLMGGSA
jgi:hypothetical protein